MSTTEEQKHYIENVLVNKIMKNIPNEKFLNCEIIRSEQLDGFMSTLFLLDIKTMDEKSKEEKLHKLIAKFMKSHVSFRKSSKSYEQFANENFIYGKVLPYYEEILSKSLMTNATMLPDEKSEEKSSINVKNWTARTFYVEYGLIQGLSDGKTNESVLVLENLKPLGFRTGPKLYFDREHLLLSVKTLGEYHAFSYAMRIKNDPKMKEFIDEIIPLSFVKTHKSKINYSTQTQAECNKMNEKMSKIEENQSGSKRKRDDNDDNVEDVVISSGKDDNDVDKDNSKDTKTNNFYDILYRVAFDRLYMFIDKLQSIKDKNNDSNNENLLQFINNKIDNEFFDNLNAFKSKWFKDPTKLLEFLRCDSIDNVDDVFPVILHGDYNRNNLMYQYNESEGFKNPIAVKMIDFQELRYGTPAFDLSFHMYMNVDPSIRDDYWMELLKFYHDSMINTLAKILNVNVDDESLNPYRFEKFNEHFTKYAFYGVLICIHFLPWMTCSDDELEKLSHHFETDMYGKDFHQISIEAGGDESNKCVTEIVQHAIKMGYMKYLL